MKLFLPVLFFLFQQMTGLLFASFTELVLTGYEQSLILVWERNGETVHKFRDYNDNLDLQDENFKNRTSLFLDKLKDGNFSLNLKNVTRNDGGNYTCSTDNTTVAVIDLTFSESRSGWSDPNPVVTSVLFWSTADPSPASLHRSKSWTQKGWCPNFNSLRFGCTSRISYRYPGSEKQKDKC
uniref:Ig-like domain-containing protein n=1 Tax=Echeneis naucrates TaxID=173247 RepID=A0A665TFY0_ECHNA